MMRASMRGGRTETGATLYEIANPCRCTEVDKETGRAGQPCGQYAPEPTACRTPPSFGAGQVAEGPARVAVRPASIVASCARRSATASREWLAARAERGTVSLDGVHPDTVERGDEQRCGQLRLHIPARRRRRGQPRGPKTIQTSQGQRPRCHRRPSDQGRGYAFRMRARRLS